MPTYVQPIAQHRVHPERLLLAADDGRSYVWRGDDPDAGPEEIESSTATWLQRRSWLRPLPFPRFWLHVADLPLAPVPSRESEVGRRE